MDKAFHYESEIEEVLLTQSEKQYGVKEAGCLMAYLMRRSLIVGIENGKIPKVKKEDLPNQFMRFWLNDLSVPIKDDSFTYKETRIPAHTNLHSPLQNIFDNLLHQLSMAKWLGKVDDSKDDFQAAQREVSEWIKEAKKQSIKYRKKDIYPYVVQRKALDFLNQKYQANVQLPSKIPHIQYHELMYKLSQEEICNRHISAFNFDVRDGELLSEAELEHYVIRHLEDIEPGLRFVKSQYLLPNGRIDVLARDKDNQYVVIELKVEKDTDVVWQKWYYTNEIKKQFRCDTVRFMVILPTFYPELIPPLLEDSTPTQILRFSPVIQNGKLKEASFETYQAS